MGNREFIAGRRSSLDHHRKKLRNQGLHASIRNWLYVPAEDTDVIDNCLAVYKSHEIPGDPLWAMLIDASGGGKTELIRAFRGRSDSYFLSKMTSKSLGSGYRDKTDPNKDLSILPQLNDKIFLIKDLAPLLSMRESERNEILAYLRDVYDGFTDDSKGNLGRISYEVRFTCLTATTQAIEQYSGVEQELGERFN